MKKDVCAEMARRRYPVVALENGAHGEIVYPQIRFYGIKCATPEEIEQGTPPVNLEVVLWDRCGHSQTVVYPRQLRLPTDDEAIEAAQHMTLSEVDDMLEVLKRLREEEKG